MVLNTRNKIEDMSIGDTIPCRYTATSGVAGVFSELGVCTAADIPVTGTATPDGKFNFIKADKGILIADRVVQTGISWDVLNTARYIEGIPFMQSLVPIMTSDTTPTGKVSYSNQYLTWSPGAYAAFAGGEWHAGYYSHDQWIQYNFTTPTIVNGYQFNSGYMANKAPRTFRLDVWDGTKWLFLDRQVNKPGVNYDTRYFDAPNTTPYASYRFFVEAIDNTFMSVGSLRFISKSYSQCIRSISGGNAYLGTDGKASLIDKGLGAWPINNEWDTYIVKSDLGGTVTPGDDNVWHWQGVYSWGQDTSIVPLASSSSRIMRGKYTTIKVDPTMSSNSINLTVGFRPVLEYPEDPRCTNIWY
jgi:hypothetical protein